MKAEQLDDFKTAYHEHGKAICEACNTVVEFDESDDVYDALSLWNDHIRTNHREKSVPIRWGGIIEFICEANDTQPKWIRAQRVDLENFESKTVLLSEENKVRFHDRFDIAGCEFVGVTEQNGDVWGVWSLPDGEEWGVLELADWNDPRMHPEEIKQIE